MVEGVLSAVGLSKKLDALEAGAEVANDLNRKLSGAKPDLVLLFSTIHYNDHGGFQNLLKGVYSILNQDTLVVGGTVAGFTIPQGCFTRGVTAFGIKSEKIDFAVAVAKNIKRDPKKAAEVCAAEIKSVMSKSLFNNKFLLTLPSGTTTPKIPFFSDNLRVIPSKFLSRLLLIGAQLSLLLFQKGPGREEDIIDTLAVKLPEYKIIGGSFIDDNKGYSNYQFYKKQIFTNMLITIGMSTNMAIAVNSDFGLVQTDKKFRITKSSVYGLVIEKINGKPAFSEILNILHWPKYFIEDSARILKKTFYVPIGYYVNGQLFTSIIAFIYGEGVVVSPKVRSEDACIMNASGKQLIDIVDTNLKDTKNKDIGFGIITSCIVRLETLGAASYKVHEKLKEHFKDISFIEIYVVGEDVYTSETGPKRIANSYNTAVFYKKE